jgi:alkylation response protein AidB-like acyl-CoA dehydrogenase
MDGAAAPDYETLLSRLRALAPLVEGEAAESERARTLTPKLVEAVVETDLMLATLPHEVGGAERSAPELATLFEELARQDGSTGWCFGMNGIITGIAAAMLPEAGRAHVFDARPPGRTLLAGGFPPQGRAERTRDGWTIRGHFHFGSGCRHAHAMLCTCIELVDGAVRMQGSTPAMRSFVLSLDQIRIDDNWNVAGLEGTASCDYHADSVLVPDELSFSSGTTFAPLRGRSLYSLPLLSLAGAPHAGFALGVGRRALEEIAEHAGWRQRLGSRAALADRPAFQQAFGRANAHLRAARALVLETLQALHEPIRRGDPVPLNARADAAAATTNAYESAVEAATFAFRAAGGAALFRSGRLQRCFRDIQAGAQHIVVSDESYERAAQVWLGVGEPQML